MEINKELQEKGVSNNQMFMNLSNLLDSIPGFKDSNLRNNIHGLYHSWIGNLKENNGNLEGAKAERERAQFQYNRVDNIKD